MENTGSALMGIGTAPAAAAEAAQAAINSPLLEIYRRLQKVLFAIADGMTGMLIQMQHE
jgi:cell division GTPase FtsZ